MLTSPEKFTGVNVQICADAWDLIFPSIKSANAFGITNKLAGTIIVVDPGVVGSADVPILFQAHVGEEEDNVKYTEIANAKAFVSWHTGLSSRVVQQDAPHLYQPGDTKWGGSLVRNGLIVAFSGVQAVFDEMIAGWMADAIIALCRDEMTRPGGVMASEDSFLSLD